MTVLLTNFELDRPTGTTLYIRDLALELHRCGHRPIVYTKRLGAISNELRSAGIQVTRHLRHLRMTPDVIHGHHWMPTLEVIRRFSATPAIQICHDHTALVDGALLHPAIRRYFGVSQLCIERFVREGVPSERIELLHNFVDTRRFGVRAPLPVRPARALVFSNYAHSGTHLPAITDACRTAGLSLEVIGQSAGRFEARPELRLSRYDIVFAKGKAALEAMATGTAVILCDYGGVGPMVTPDNFEQLRLMNFGYQALSDPLGPEPLLREIRRYDPRGAAQVCAAVRQQASLTAAVDFLSGVYGEVIDEQTVHGKAIPTHTGLDLHRRSVRSRALLGWSMMPEAARRFVKRVPGAQMLIFQFWKLYG